MLSDKQLKALAVGEVCDYHSALHDGDTPDIEAAAAWYDAVMAEDAAYPSDVTTVSAKCDVAEKYDNDWLYHILPEVYAFAALVAREYAKSEGGAE